MKTKLTPCPFCGEKAAILELGNNIWCAKCKKCGAMSAVYFSKKETAKAWNRRETDA